MGIVEDIGQCVSMDLKTPGHRLVVASAPVDRGGLEEAKALHDRVSGLIRSGKVHAAHDVSDGGLAVAIAEMCIGGACGASVDIDEADYTDDLFLPIATTYVLEMSEADAKGSGFPVIGTVEKEPRLRVTAPRGVDMDVAVSRLADAWRAPLANGGGH